MSKDTNKKGFRLGRNLGTMLIVIGAVAIIFLTILMIERGKAWSDLKTNVTAYSDTDKASYVKDQIDLDNVERVKYKNFDYMDIDFYCSLYTDNQENYYVKKKSSDTCDNKDKLTFKLTLSKNSNTGKPRTQDGYIAYANVGIAQDTIGDEAYSTTLKSYTDSTIFSTSSSTFSVTSTVSYPCKVKSWPFSKTIKTPNAYVYLKYLTYDDSGNQEIKEFIIEYKYSEYMTSSSEKGIIE
ncbi:MAG: hypothetical protein K6E20_01315 [Acholeplasmatales bacterium]|nr:hypothetical protein [Acholeplasmatales bacterium]